MAAEHQINSSPSSLAPSETSSSAIIGLLYMAGAVAAVATSAKSDRKLTCSRSS